MRAPGVLVSGLLLVILAGVLLLMGWEGDNRMGTCTDGEGRTYKAHYGGDASGWTYDDDNGVEHFVTAENSSQYECALDKPR